MSRPHPTNHRPSRDGKGASPRPVRSATELLAFQQLRSAAERFSHDLSLWIEELNEEVLTTLESVNEHEFMLRLMTEGFFREAKWALDLLGRRTRHEECTTKFQEWARDIQNIVTDLWNLTFQNLRAIRPTRDGAQEIGRFRSLLRCHWPAPPRKSSRLRQQIKQQFQAMSRDAEAAMEQVDALLLANPDQWNRNDPRHSPDRRAGRKRTPSS